MLTGLHSALTGIIDYAGLFPPARLPMDEAVASFQRHKSGPEAWIVSRFVCPVLRLTELGSILKASPSAPVPLTVVGSASASGPVRASLAADARAMMAFDESYGDLAEIESFELKLSSADIQAGALSDLQAFEAIEVYVELGWTDDLPENLARLAGEDWLRAKARTGGTEAAAFPSSKTLSAFLKHCVDLDLEFKLTAGLHHAFRHWDESLSVSHHGYLNVLAACALHEAHDLSIGEIAVILDEGPFGALKCGSDGFAFENLRANWDDVHRARELFKSFGSCSIEEPLESLEQLGAGEGSPA